MLPHEEESPLTGDTRSVSDSGYISAHWRAAPRERPRVQ
jgi:hypothetical protein